MTLLKLLFFYLLCINLLGFIMMGADKRRAKKRAFRIPESTLFTVAILGGVIGSMAGMYVFRHKTKHFSFVFGMPLIIFIHAAILGILYSLCTQ